jgi:hypothetical protein
MGGWKQKEERGSKIPPLLFCSLHFLVSISAVRLSVSVSRVCAPTLPLANTTIRVVVDIRMLNTHYQTLMSRYKDILRPVT